MEMPDSDKELLAVQLDADRRREINAVKQNFEEFYRQEIQFQAEMKSDMSVVKEQQKGLKERFEEGVSKRLAGLDGKFDKFLIEWGKKQEQDKMRDERIEIVDDKIIDNTNNLNWLIRSLIISVCSGVLLAIIIYAFKYIQ